MDSTTKRFNNGVHAEGKCGRNTSGYAAISPAMEKHNVHELDIETMSPLPVTTGHRKKPFLTSDIIAYLLLKSVHSGDFQRSYVILLSSALFMTSTIEKMIQSMVESMSVVIIVNTNNEEFTVRAILSGAESSCIFSGSSSLMSFFENINKLTPLAVVAYPTVTREYFHIMSMDNVSSWCVPATISDVYISSGYKSFYKHNAFPWSKYPHYSGFTLGRGKIRRGNVFDVHRFIGSFNYYERMISSVPYKDSCVDCYALKIAADMIELMIDNRPQKKLHRLSASSIEALDELNKRMQEVMELS